MKAKFYISLTIIILISINNLKAQLLLESKTGDPLFVPLISARDSQNARNVGLVKLNTSDQSLGFDYFNSPNTIGNPKYKFWSIGFKTKPTEGYSSVFKNGDFSPGISFSGAITQVKIFDKEKTKPENNFLDWGSIYFNYAINKYQLYKSDTAFKNQVFSTNFNGFGFGANYNMLFNSTSLISIKFGYARGNNYDDLTSVEVRDVKRTFDSTSNTNREVITSKTAKQGTYKEFDTYPIGISYTKLTSDDPKNKGLPFGYSIYFNALPTNNDKPISNAGCILYLAKMKDGISTPTLGLNFQFSDFFDTKGLNNGLFKRFNIGITSAFTIF